MTVRRGGDGIESRVERPGFLEIGTPARKRNEGVQGDSVAARGQNVGKQRTAEQRPPHFRYLFFRQSRPADREPRFLQRLAQRGDARRSIGFVDAKPIEARDAIIDGETGSTTVYTPVPNGNIVG